jgi:hypothetical protein
MSDTELQGRIDQELCRQILVRRAAVKALQADAELVAGDNLSLVIEGTPYYARIEPRHLTAVALLDANYPLNYDIANPPQFKIAPPAE